MFTSYDCCIVYSSCLIFLWTSTNEKPILFAFLGSLPVPHRGLLVFLCGKRLVSRAAICTTTTASRVPDMERSYVQMVAHLQDDTGAIVAVGDDDKEGEAVEDGQL